MESNGGDCAGESVGRDPCQDCSGKTHFSIRIIAGRKILSLYSRIQFDFVCSFAGCKDALPSKMKSNSNCKKLKMTCTKLKSKCSSKLGSALGNSSNGKKCKSALGSLANKRVKEFCKKTCTKCSKPRR